jgi:hypothetical protein
MVRESRLDDGGGFERAVFAVADIAQLIAEESGIADQGFTAVVVRVPEYPMVGTAFFDEVVHTNDDRGAYGALSA